MSQVGLTDFAISPHVALETRAHIAKGFILIAPSTILAGGTVARVINPCKEVDKKHYKITDKLHNAALKVFLLSALARRARQTVPYDRNRT